MNIFRFGTSSAVQESKQVDAQAAPLPPDSMKARGGTPLELIKWDTETGKFVVGDKALNILRQVKGPVGVVSVCGRARQGKSFILNQLLGQTSGFQVAPTHRPCTKGLWMWSSPVERRNPDGSGYHLVLLDTEGIDAWDQTGQYSTQIFSLAVLLSSLFVYNNLGGIDEAALDRLSLVTEMTRHIRVRAASTGEGSDDLATFTPAFLWLLRDFYLRLEEDGRQVTPKEYLETALQSVCGSGDAVVSKNKIRESIKSLFPDRDCFALVRPVNDEELLNKLETLPPSQMRPEFRQGLAKLTGLIFSKAQPKRLGSQVVTGALLAGLTEAYVHAINEGAVPTIATAWQGVVEAECRRAADAAELVYIATFDEKVVAEEASLDREHQRALQAAQMTFQEAALGEGKVLRANEERFRQASAVRFQRFKQQRLAQAALACEKLISQETQKLTEMARQPGMTVEAIMAEVERFEALYRETPEAAGPGKWERHAAFMRQTYSGVLQDLFLRQEQTAQQQVAEALTRTQQADALRLKAEATVARAMAEGQRALAAQEQLRSQLHVERQTASSSSQRVAALELQLHEAKARAEATESALREQIAGLQVLSSKGTAQCSELQKALARERIAGEQATTAISRLEVELAEARRHMGELQQQLQQEHGAKKEHFGVLEQLRQQLQDQSLAALTAQREVGLHRAELESLQRQLATSSLLAQNLTGKCRDAEQQREVAENLWQEAVQREKSALAAVATAEAELHQLRQREQVRKQELQQRLRELEAEALKTVQAGNHQSPPPHATEAGAQKNDEEAVDAKEMTIPQLKTWLMDHGHEDKAWELSQKSRKAKKDDWVQAVAVIQGSLQF